MPMTRWRAFGSEASSNATSAPPSSSYSLEGKVQLTQSAIKRLHELSAKAARPQLLRLQVNSGGCSGFQYDFTIEDKQQENDIVLQQDGCKLLIDDVSLAFLEDCQIDYVEEMIRASFQVKGNKSASTTCSCGHSFDVGFS